MARQYCIIHYDTIKTSDSLIRICESSYEALLECKTIREYLGGENCHSEQSSGIPINYIKECYYHRECYQKFAYARALKKRKLENDESQDPSAKVIRATTGQHPDPEKSRPRGLFPDICMICNKKMIKVSQKKQHLTKIVTETAEKTLKDAAAARNDTEMNIAVANIDLIAKEFQKHEKCYRECTLVFRENIEAGPSNETQPTGSYDAVLSLVDNDIIGGQQCLSMETLVIEYNGSPGNRQARSKLKDRLQKSYEDQLVFCPLNTIFRR